MSRFTARVVQACDVLLRGTPAPTPTPSKGHDADVFRGQVLDIIKANGPLSYKDIIAQFPTIKVGYIRAALATMKGQAIKKDGLWSVA